MSLRSGAILSGRYRLLGLIATGGMGQVWEADDTVLDRHVAVKILKPEFSSDAEFVHRFRDEAMVTARISHPGIAAVYDYGQIDDPSTGTPLSYLVMELVAGEPLSDVLAREGSLPLRHTLDMLEQTGRALSAAHALGLVHRDVKPGNILITPTGQVKLTDFGIAKAQGAASMTSTGMVVGTAQYISPEQAMGRDSTPAGDVYSLGVVGYECLAGRRPFIADSPVSIAMMHVHSEPDPLPAEIPAHVRQLLGTALAKDPRRRYQDGSAFADAVADVRAGRAPRPPAGSSAFPGAAAAGAATGATTVLPEPSRPAAPTPTRALTRVSGIPAQAGPARPAASTRSAASTRRAALPPPEKHVNRRQKPRSSGCGTWFLLVMLLFAALAVLGAIALSQLGLFGPGGLLGGPQSTPAAPPAASSSKPTPRATPTPTRTTPPSPTTQSSSETSTSRTRSTTANPSSARPSVTATNSPLNELNDMLSSLTERFSELAPTPSPQR